MTGEVPVEWAIATIRARAELAASDRQYSLLDMHRHMIAAVEPLIRAAEREECARVAERRWRDWPGIHPDDAKKGEVCDDVTACADIAATIRARDAELQSIISAIAEHERAIQDEEARRRLTPADPADTI